jgi:hypothetical protein
LLVGRETDVRERWRIAGKVSSSSCMRGLGWLGDIRTLSFGRRVEKCIGLRASFGLRAVLRELRFQACTAHGCGVP